jgi:hypothetical protein
MRRLLAALRLRDGPGELAPPVPAADAQLLTAIRTVSPCDATLVAALRAKIDMLCAGADGEFHAMSAYFSP